MTAPPRFAPDWLVERPIAHRGLHDRECGIVENSRGAVRAAMLRGYAIECDLRLSRDGVVFVFHDDELDRLTDDSGAFAERDAVELARISLSGAGETIPSFAEWLAAIGGAVPVILELKSDFSGDLSLAGAVAEVLAAYSGPAAIKSFDPALIAALRAVDAPWPLGIVAQDDYEDPEFERLSPDQWRELARFTHARATRPDFLSWRAMDLPTAVVELARAMAVPVMAWTIRSPQQAAAACRHADQIVFEGYRP
ncbi:glycerophosphodiester phosphodiesterase family protein [Rhodoblastus sp.]|uniref:glycerophosphodiester phosphodiesterase family protein n=1 Tax=Rhodoblastus sp. TaxID=1962975 RepID=UPI00263A3572|nr:glycerophosphodiester phosphodiesterase family protein [Rhodoblastus sp.]